VKLIDELRAEHDLIERVAGSLRAYARARSRGEASSADGPRFLAFFRLYAGRFHHGREEDTLFVALQRDAELPGDRGPVAALLDDHHRMARLLDGMEPLAGSEGPGAAEAFETIALEYSEQLLHHVDAENSVMLPESELRLRRHAVHELPTREMTGEEAAARATGEELVLAYPPRHEPGIVRGDGCVVCPAFTRTCQGVEREWWNLWEWEEFEDHLPSG
jgi:hemerythrin-like domain-containing protein